MALVAPEAPSEQARRVFQTYDPEDNGFIPDTLLEDVMKALDLVSDPEYVNLMKTKLDPEGLGIILLGPFLQEFFPDQQDYRVLQSTTPKQFCTMKQSGLSEECTAKDEKIRVSVHLLGIYKIRSTTCNCPLFLFPFICTSRNRNTFTKNIT
uniref:Ubiquitin carboxyl-terminal hydrolase MINDY-3 n=1 Tax=Pavo cristatus TaxID=9049 RepID=A0A8C9LDC2_PAVCR